MKKEKGWEDGKVGLKGLRALGGVPKGEKIVVFLPFSD